MDLLLFHKFLGIVRSTKNTYMWKRAYKMIFTIWRVIYINLFLTKKHAWDVCKRHLFDAFSRFQRQHLLGIVKLLWIFTWNRLNYFMSVLKRGYIICFGIKFCPLQHDCLIGWTNLWTHVTVLFLVFSEKRTYKSLKVVVSSLF